MTDPALSPAPNAAGVIGETLETAGQQATSFLFADLPAFVTRLLLAALAIFIGCIVIRIGRRMITRLVRRRRGTDKSDQQVDTLRSLIISVFNYIFYFIIITVVLGIFGVNVASLIAVAGVGGVAIGFGAQTLIKDVISGVFLWLEGSMTVGDIVEINGLSGEVEAIAIRTTSVRNANGNLYVIPNGDIRTVINMSRAYKKAIVDIRCPYEEPQEKLTRVLTEEMEKAGREVEGLTEQPEVLGILSFDPDAVVIRLAVQCPVKENWRIERELRRRVKDRFDKEGIQMPHYQRPAVH